jgi:hypothetical protein
VLVLDFQASPVARSVSARSSGTGAELQTNNTIALTQYVKQAATSHALPVSCFRESVFKTLTTAIKEGWLANAKSPNTPNQIVRI